AEKRKARIIVTKTSLPRNLMILKKGSFIAAIFIPVFIGVFLTQAAHKKVSAPEENPAAEEDLHSYSFQNSPLPLSLSYPALLTAAPGENSITLQHDLPYVHIDPCDFKGDAPEQQTLADFAATFRLLPGNLKSVIAAKEGAAFVSDNWSNETPALSPGFIDQLAVNDFSGYKITLGVENCGSYHYYFTVDRSHVLYIERPIVTELTDSVQSDL